MKKMWREMFPGDLEEQLEFLHDTALDLSRRLRARRNPMRLNPEEALEKEVRSFFARVREKDDIIGVSRGTRILRHRAGEVYGLDPSAQYGNLEEAAAWVDRVVENIEDVAAEIDRKQIRWMTFWSTIAAAAAAILAFVGVVIGAVALFVRPQ